MTEENRIVVLCTAHDTREKSWEANDIDQNHFTRSSSNFNNRDNVILAYDGAGVVGVVAVEFSAHAEPWGEATIAPICTAMWRPTAVVRYDGPLLVVHFQPHDSSGLYILFGQLALVLLDDEYTIRALNFLPSLSPTISPGNRRNPTKRHSASHVKFHPTAHSTSNLTSRHSIYSAHGDEQPCLLLLHHAITIHSPTGPRPLPYHRPSLLHNHHHQRRQQQQQAKIIHPLRRRHSPPHP